MADLEWLRLVDRVEVAGAIGDVTVIGWLPRPLGLEGAIEASGPTVLDALSLLAARIEAREQRRDENRKSAGE